MFVFPQNSPRKFRSEVERAVAAANSNRSLLYVRESYEKSWVLRRQGYISLRVDTRISRPCSAFLSLSRGPRPKLDLFGRLTLTRDV